MTSTPVAEAIADLPAPIPSRTPQLLRRLQVVVALAALLAGVSWVWVIVDLRGDLASAPNLAQQYARLGQVQHSLNRAAVLADRSVIAGEAADGPIAASAAGELATAAGLLVEAGPDRPQDAAALAGLGRDVTRYAVELTSAAGASRTQALPTIARAADLLDGLTADIAGLQEALVAEASARPWSQGSPVPALVTVAMLGVLGWASWVIARLSRRVLNVGLVVAAVALASGLGLTTAAQTTAAEASQASRGTQFGQVVTATTAVTQLESAHRVLSSGVLEQKWNSSRQDAYDAAYQAAADAAAQQDLIGVQSFHAAAGTVVELLTKADWKGAAQALLADGGDALDARAVAFRTNADVVAADAAAGAAREPEAARSGLVTQLVLAIVIALGAAALGVLGIDRRWKEYQ